LADAVIQSASPITSTLNLSSKEVDPYEIALIALFGDGTLNIEPGGRDSMVLTEADHSASLSLGHTKLVHSTATSAEGKGLLLSTPKPCSNGISQAVLDYAGAVRVYVEDHPSTTSLYEFGDQTQSVIIEKSTLSMLQSTPDTSLLVTVGSDFSELEDNRSAVAIQDCFNHFALWEQPLGAKYDPNTVKQLARAHALPFVNLFAWVRRT
jgi:hypothetical protein